MDKMFNEVIKGFKINMVEFIYVLFFVFKELFEQGGMYMQVYY